ncbi:MAG: endonuclease domain-containing protein [Bacteroidota bacterium]
MKPRHSPSKLTPVRKHLRNNGTSAEAYLWNYLKQAQLEGRKFRRQHSIEYYIVDFFYYSEMLAIELDGAYHLNLLQQERDNERDAFLREVGIKVLRFENQYVFENTDWALDEIRKHFEH